MYLLHLVLICCFLHDFIRMWNFKACWNWTWFLPVLHWIVLFLPGTDKLNSLQWIYFIFVWFLKFPSWVFEMWFVKACLNWIQLCIYCIQMSFFLSFHLFVWVFCFRLDLLVKALHISNSNVLFQMYWDIK